MIRQCAARIGGFNTSEVTRDGRVAIPGSAKTVGAFVRTHSDYTARWQRMTDDGDHYRLAFDRPGTWSQKYNLAWDTVFGLGLFPPEVMRKELAFYRGKRLAYGTPLDSRSPAAKPEWAIWVATMAESKEAFEEFVAPIHRYVDETPNRVPLADIYFAHTGRRRANQARSVVGRVLHEAAGGAVEMKRCQHVHVLPPRICGIFSLLALTRDVD